MSGFIPYIIYVELLLINFHRPLELPSDVRDVASKHDFEVKAFQIGAAKEQMRPPKIVRIGLIQNKIVLPTSAPLQEQVLHVLPRQEIPLTGTGFIRNCAVIRVMFILGVL